MRWIDYIKALIKLRRDLDKMKIAIIDADLIGRSKHRFSNLAEFEKRYPQIAKKYFDIKWNK